MNLGALFVVNAFIAFVATVPAFGVVAVAMWAAGLTTAPVATLGGMLAFGYQFALALAGGGVAYAALAPYIGRRSVSPRLSVIAASPLSVVPFLAFSAATAGLAPAVFGIAVAYAVTLGVALRLPFAGSRP